MNIEQEKIELLSLIAFEKSEAIIKHKNWNIISNNYYLLFELLKEGKFTYIDRIPQKMFNHYSLSFFVFRNKNSLIKVIPKKYLNDLSFITQVLEDNFANITRIPKKYLNNEELIEWFCYRYSHLEPLKYIKSIQNIKLLSHILEKNPKNYEYLSIELKNNKDIFQIVSNKSSIFFSLAGEKIKNDQLLALEEIEKSPHTYSYVGPKLCNSVEFFLQLLELNFNILQYATFEIRDNEKCVWESVKNYPISLQYASPRLLETSSFCRQISQNISINQLHDCFCYWSAVVKNDKELILELLPLLCTSHNLQYISHALKNDFNLMQKAAQIDVETLRQVGNDLACNSEFYLKLHKYYAHSFNVYNFIQEKATQNIPFILNLYDNLGTDFLDIVFPKIQNHNNSLIQLMKKDSLLPNGLFNFMERLKLKIVLDKDLITHKNKKTHKI